MARSSSSRLTSDLAELLGVSTSTLQRYAAGSYGAAAGGGFSWMQQLWRTVFGGAGLKSSAIPRALKSTIEALQVLAPTPEPETRRTGRGGSRRQVDFPPQTAPTSPGRTPPNRTGGQPPPPIPGQPQSFPRTVIPREPPKPGDVSEYGEEIFTPQSSNVFSFSYYRQPGARNGTLYVTYKANSINPGSITSGTTTRGGRKSRTQNFGQLGRTVRGKKNERGPMYAYLNVPPIVFTGMKSAVSKGKFVWDKLRIRGTIYGHRFQYTLVQAQVTPGLGSAGVYIPRKATSKGFRTRSISNVGTGRRGFQTSTLPQQNGFSTRRVRGR